MARFIELVLCAVGAALFTSGFLFADVRRGGRSACGDLAVGDPALAHEAAASARALRGAGLLPAASLRDDGARHWPWSNATEPVGGLDWRTADAPERVGASCWMPARFRRAAVVVVDALRYDFVRAVHEDRARWFHNRMPLLQRTLRGDPRARLYAFEAETPTVTMQRVKGLTTGALPTFVEVRDNFDAPAAREDSLVAQAARLGRRQIFLGDDTWTMLYPDLFNVTRPYDSFNIRDMHTVDDGVHRDLLPALRNGTLGSWEVLVAHFLGVDHAGHRFGPAHPAMAAKLAQMDRAVADVLAAVDNDTVVAVLGDHGMTGEGNHGGATRAETAAALVLFAKRPLFTSQLLRAAGCGGASRAPPQGPTDDPTWAGAEALWLLGDSARAVPQVDFAPTLALLLGLPVPYSSVGRVLEDLATDPALARMATQRPRASCGDLAAAAARQELLQQLVNAWQLHRMRGSLPDTRYDAARVLGLHALRALGRPVAAGRAGHLRWAFPAGSSEPRSEVLQRAAAAAAAVRSVAAAAVAAARAGTRFRTADMVRGTILIALAALRGLLGTDPQPRVSAWTIGAAASAALGWRVLGVPDAAAPLAGVLLGSVPFAAAVGLALPIGDVAVPQVPVDVVVSAMAVAYAAAPLAVPATLAQPEALTSAALVATTLLVAHRAVRKGAAWGPTAVAAVLALGAQAAGTAWSRQRLEESPRAMSFLVFLLSTLGPAAALVGVSYRLAAGHVLAAHWTTVATAAALGYWFLNRAGVLEPFEDSMAVARLGLPRMAYLLSAAACVAHALRRRVVLAALALLPALALLHGPRAPRSLLAMALHGAAAHQLFNSTRKASAKRRALWLVLAAWHWFFATGHGPRIADLQTAAPYVGWDVFDLTRGAVMVFANTFGSFLMVLVVGLALLLRDRGPDAAALVARRASGVFALQAAVTLAVTTLGRNGPRVWTDLAPRALFDLAALLTATAVAGAYA